MKKYIKMVSDVTNEDFHRVKQRMDAVKKLYDISYKDYYKKELYLLPEGSLVKAAAMMQRKKQNRNAAFQSVQDLSGMSREEIVAKIKQINENAEKKLNIFFYEKFELYKLSDDEIAEVQGLILKRDAMRDALLGAFALIDAGKKSYEDIEGDVKAFYQVIAELLTDTFRGKLHKVYFVGRKYANLDEAEVERIYIDMEATRLLLGFSFPEYVSFHFEEKSLETKRAYISNRERMTVLSSLNEDKGSELLNNKVECYALLKPFYRRKQVYIQSMDDYPAFKDFCSGLNVFVKKSVALSMGKGIEPIKISKDTDLKALMEQLLEESGSFAAEEMITIHRKLKKLNPTSVNTIRLETYFDGQETIFGDAFMRVGQGGAFVDNAGAGGIFVAVDPQTGRVTSDGFDEYGNVYLRHPDTGMVFKGYQLPAWKKALKLGREISHQVPGVSFIGWDLVYTNKRKWVIVEGNAKPQIICNQTSQGKGLRTAFLSRVGEK